MATVPPASSTPPPEENIHFYTLNVGQADSHVIHFPNRDAAAVIDPGNGKAINDLLYKHLRIKELPFILVSHFDLDHMEGINEVIKKNAELYPPPSPNTQTIFFNDTAYIKSKEKKRLGEVLDEFNFLVKKYSPRLEVAISDQESGKSFTRRMEELGLEGRILYPSRLQLREPHEKKDSNLSSVLLYLAFAGKKILYSGDLPMEGWEKSPAEDLKSDVFKIPHHGGRISNNSGKDTRKILEHVDPRFALVSVGGANSHHHPLPEVIEAIVSHEGNPHLFCTQMTGQCCSDPAVKEKIEDFYRDNLPEGDGDESGDGNGKMVFSTGTANGTPCAGTIRVNFSRNEEHIHTLPPAGVHLRMLKKLLNPNGFLCRSRLPAI